MVLLRNVQGEAIEYVHGHFPDMHTDMNLFPKHTEILAALETRYLSDEKREEYATELQHVVQNGGEGFRHYAERVYTLAKRAHPKEPETSRIYRLWDLIKDGILLEAVKHEMSVHTARGDSVKKICAAVCKEEMYAKDQNSRQTGAAKSLSVKAQEDMVAAVAHRLQSVEDMQKELLRRPVQAAGGNTTVRAPFKPCVHCSKTNHSPEHCWFYLAGPGAKEAPWYKSENTKAQSAPVPAPVASAAVAVKKKAKKKKKAAEPGVSNGQAPVRQETASQTKVSETLKV